MALSGPSPYLLGAGSSALAFSAATIGESLSGLDLLTFRTGGVTNGTNRALGLICRLNGASSANGPAIYSGLAATDTTFLSGNGGDTTAASMDVAALYVLPGYPAPTGDFIASVESYASSRFSLGVTPPAFSFDAQSLSGWTQGESSPIIALGTGSDPDEKVASAPSIIKVSGTYYVCYRGLDSSNKDTICLASGSSLTSLSKQGIILQSPGSGWDSSYVAGGRLYDDTAGVTGKYLLFFFGSSAGGFEGAPADIGVATATNPSGPYTEYGSNPIVTHGSASWNAQILYRAFVLRDGAGTYHMLINGRNNSSIETIGHYTASDPRGPWAEVSGNPCIDVDTWSTARVGDITILKNPRVGSPAYVAFFFGQTIAGTPIGEGIATSDDLTTWTKWSGNPIPLLYSGACGIRADVVWTGSTYEMLFDTGDGSDNSGIYHAILDVATQASPSLNPAILTGMFFLT